MKTIGAIFLVAVFCIPAPADQTMWNLEKLSQPPQTYPAPDWKEAGVEALFYDGLPWKGKPTRAFAWIGMPAHAPGEKVPAMVLVHGGGGTAFADWLRLP